MFKMKNIYSLHQINENVLDKGYILKIICGYRAVGENYNSPRDTIFPRLLTLCITFFIPLQLISIAPAKYLLNCSSKYMLIFEMICSIILLWVCYKFLKCAISSYTSASS
jgi:ABC-type uncharacterized transport system permease subunit